MLLEIAVSDAWGSGLLMCQNSCFEGDYDEPRGAAVRSWNRHNKPKEKKS